MLPEYLNALTMPNKTTGRHVMAGIIQMTAAAFTVCSCCTLSSTSENRQTSYSYSSAGEVRQKTKLSQSDNTQKDDYTRYTPDRCFHLSDEYRNECLSEVVGGAEKQGRIQKVSSHLVFDKALGEKDVSVSLADALRKNKIKRITINYNMNGTDSPFEWICRVTDRLDFTIDFGKEVHSVRGMFRGCTISGFPKIATAGITDMSYMFEEAVLNGNMPEYDMSSVTDMSHMFYQAEINGAINFTDTGRVTSAEYMFAGSKINTELPLFNTAAVTSMKSMFRDAVFNNNGVPLYDTSEVKNMSGMFANSSITSVPLFNTKKVTDMSRMFSRTKKLRQIPLFDTANVTDMQYLVSESSVESVPDLNRSSLKRDPENQCTYIQSILYDAGNLDSETKELWKEEYACAAKWQASYQKHQAEQTAKSSDMVGLKILCILTLPVCGSSISTAETSAGEGFLSLVESTAKH